jgi:hypothetical protein
MTNMIKDIFDKQVLELKKLWANKRQLLFQLLNLAMIVFSALMIWKALMCYTKVGGSAFAFFGLVCGFRDCINYSLFASVSLNLSFRHAFCDCFDIDKE